MKVMHIQWPIFNLSETLWKDFLKSRMAKIRTNEN